MSEEIMIEKVSYADLQNKFIECNTDRIRLQQENQQLKEDYNEAATDGTEWESRYYNLQDKWDATILKLDHENKILKSVLDEIREYIKECTSSPDEYENFISSGEVIHLLQILDKVKE